MRLGVREGCVPTPTGSIANGPTTSTSQISAKAR